MDLRSIINTEAVDNQAQKPPTPITPVQSGTSQHSFRDFHPLQPAAKHPPQDHSHRASDPYVSPTSYQPAYQGRPSAPPPLQPPSHNDLRSPAGSYSGQSPYARNTPTSSVSGGYPFPQNQTPQSPAQPLAYQHQALHRDSYPQAYPPQPQHQHSTYGQPNSIPNTPVGTPGGANPYFPHQRSQSSHSTSTPTSTQSQQQYHSQYPQENPVSAGPFTPGQAPQNQRQQSQPQTPLGPPISYPRQNSAPYQQPTSPYQQRPPSSGAIYTSHAYTNAAPPHSLPQQLQRQSSAPTVPIIQSSSQTSAADSNPRSQTIKRERSLSVSPKTRPQSLQHSEMATSETRPVENGQVDTPKRKREASENASPHTVSPHGTNGNQSANTSTPSPQHPVRKRRRYNEPPIWAQSFVEHIKIKERAGVSPNATRSINGRPADRLVKAEAVNGHNQIEAATTRPPPTAQLDFRGDGPLGPWEPSIIGYRPFEEVSKRVADWLYRQVVTRADAGELASRGVEIEIEAKLGQLIAKDTNERFQLPVESECILANTGKVTFKSSMTELQHKSLNDFLNKSVAETHPDNPKKQKPRVPIVYLHRRERDTFYELPPSIQVTLPASIRKELNPRHTVKVRVSHDQKTGQLLAKIIKTRVADLDVYFPCQTLDCRISVNLEMRYDGDLESLIASTGSSRMPDRNKDRLSYTQSHYQIDLTQVTVADGTTREKEHELEIELSAATVREQGRRAMAGEHHQYGELIEGLMDNIRVLTRHVTGNSTST